MSCIKVLACLLSLLISACASVKSAPLIYSPGNQVETLSTSVSLSLNSSAGSMGGHGFMVFRRPDQVHLVMLSPFGSTQLEAFALGDRIVIVYPSQKIAYSGRFDELPDTSALQGWSLIRWVMDADPSAQTGRNGSVERALPQGGRETVTYESGLVVAKTTSTGDQVYYRDYAVVNGVPLASELEVLNARTDRIHLKLEEPEVNTILDSTAFTPLLDGMTILPLSELPVK